MHAIEVDGNSNRQPATPATNAIMQNGGLALAIPKNDSFSSEEVHFRKHPRPMSYMESKTSPGIILPRPYNRVVSYQPSIGGSSMGHSESDHNHPPPSTEKEKSKHTR